MKTSFSNPSIVIVRFISLALLLFYISSCQSFSRRYDNRWNERLNNKKLLKDYLTETNGEIVLKDLSLGNFDLNGLVVKKLIIDNSSLDSISAKESKIGLLLIKNSDLTNVTMGYTEIRTISIENSNLKKTIIGTNDNIKTVVTNSNLTDSRLDLESKRISLQGSYFINTRLTRSKTDEMEIADTDFDQNKRSHFGSMEIESLHIKDSSLNVEFQESKIKETVLENVSGSYAGFMRIVGDNFTVKDSDILSLSLAGTKTLASFVSKNSSFKRVNLVKSTIENVMLYHCKTPLKLSAYKSSYGLFKITDCTFNKFSFIQTTLNEFSIYDSKIFSFGPFSGECFEMKVNDKLTLENVTLEGEFDFSNVNINNLNTKNLKKGRNLIINYEGANFRL